MNIDRDFIFPIEVFKIFLHNHEEINENIRKQLYSTAEYNEYTTTKKYKNLAIKPTEVPSVQYVLLRAIAIVEQLTKQTYQIDADGWWFNIMKAGNSINVHSHSPGPVWSGVYYVTAPKGSSKICFTQNRTHIKELQKTKEGKKTYYYKYIGHNFQEVPYTPEPGMMLIYPSWLDHRVSMHSVPTERIAISFNLKYPFSIL